MKASSAPKKASNKGTGMSSWGKHHNNQEASASNHPSDDALSILVSSDKDLSDDNAEPADKGQTDILDEIESEMSNSTSTGSFYVFVLHLCLGFLF